MKPTLVSRLPGWCAGLLICACLPAAQADEASLLKNVPANAMVILSLADSDTLVDRWTAGPFGKLFEDEEVKRYLAPMTKDGKEYPWEEGSKELTGHSLRENFAIYKGAACLVIMGPGEDDDPSTFFEAGENEPGAMLIGEIGPDPKPFELHLTQMIEAGEEPGNTYENATEDYLGATLHLRKVTPDQGDTKIEEGWAVVGEVAVYTNSYDLLKSTVSRLKNPPVEASMPAGLAESREHFGASDATVFVDLSVVMPVVKAAFIKSMDESIQGNPLGITSESIWKTMALDDLNAVSVSFKLDPEQTEVSYYVPFKGKNGLLSLLTYSNGPLATPDFVPANASSALTGRFNLAKTWDQIFTLLSQVSPALSGMAQMQIGKFEDTAGVNIRKDLLGSLGEQIVMFEDLPKPVPGEVEAFYAFELVNRQGMESALGALRNFIGQGMAAFEERDVSGVKVYTFTIPAKAGKSIEITHAVTDRWLFVGIGSSRPMEKVLAALHTPGASLWNVPMVKSLLETSGDSIASFQYTNVGGLIETLLNTMNEAEKALPEEERSVNPDALPDPSVFTRSFGTTIMLFGETPNAYFARAILRGSSDE